LRPNYFEARRAVLLARGELRFDRPEPSFQLRDHGRRTAEVLALLLDQSQAGGAIRFAPMNLIDEIRDVRAQRWNRGALAFRLRPGVVEIEQAQNDASARAALECL
jgi:hypothetical protein